MTITFERAGKSMPVEIQSNDLDEAMSFLGYLQEDYKIEIKVTLPEIRDEYSQEGGNE